MSHMPAPATLPEAEILRLSERIAASWPSRAAHADRERWTGHIARLTPEGAPYLSLEVAMDPAQAARLHHPAQYTTLGFGALTPRFLVIASAPGERADRWRFLIKRESTLGRALEAEGAPGQPIVLSAPEGPGFGVPGPQGPPAGEVLMFTTGSGIATLRPVLDHLLDAHPDALARTTLHYGESRAEDFVYSEALARWREAGCTIRLAASQPAPGVQGRYVQEAFAPEAHDLQRATALLSGAPVMMRIVSATLLRLGVAPERLRVNV